jgi:hypothetical protein
MLNMSSTGGRNTTMRILQIAMPQNELSPGLAPVEGRFDDIDAGSGSRFVRASARQSSLAATRSRPPTNRCQP